MDSVFGNEAAVAAPVEAATKNTERSAKIKGMKDALKETLNETPEFTQKLRRLSDSVEVVNTLGFGKGGNIVVDKKASSAENRVLAPTSAIYGYRLRNVGEEAIPYVTEVYKQDETGKFVGSVVEKQWQPGETIDLTRQYTTMLCAMPEISFTLKNGKIISSSKKNHKDIKEELSSYYFSFNKSEDGTALQVNDDEVKLAIDDADGKVKPEFVEAFGYLNNPKEGRAARAKGPKFTTQDLAANYINKLIQQGGIQ